MNNNLLLSISKYSVWEAVRDKFIIFILIGMALFFLMSFFLCELPITEGTQIQSAILGSILRLFSVFTISLFVITSMIREFNDKGFELVLSHAVPRSSYFFGKFAGFSIIALFVALLCACCLCVFIPVNNALFWSFSLFCELLIVIPLSLLCLFSFNSITISFTVVIAFYVLSRSIEAIQLISDSPILLNTLSNKFINGVMDMISYIVPELYKFTKTDWLIYGVDIDANALHIIGQTLIYVVLLSCAALFDLYRKEL